MKKGNKKPKIVMVGGGSVNWAPTLLNDLLLTPGLDAAQYVILDIDAAAGERMKRFGDRLAAERGYACEFHSTDSHKDAFKGADYVIITISTGDLEAMKHDLKIPRITKSIRPSGIR